MGMDQNEAQMKNPRMVVVKAHNARVNLPERSFLRSSLRELEPELHAALEREFGETVKAI